MKLTSKEFSKEIPLLNAMPGTKVALSKTAIALLLLLVFASSGVAQSKAMKWDLKADQQFDVVLIQTSKSETKVDSRETRVENLTNLQMAWKVLKVNATGEATIEQSITGIKLEVSNPAIPAQAVKFDTSATDEEVKKFSKPSRTLLKQVKPLVGLKFNVTMAATGEIKEVVLPDATSTVINEMPGAVRLRALFSAEGIKGLMGSAAIILPEKEMQKGDSWSDEKELDTPFGKITRKRNFTLSGEKTEDGIELAEFKVEPEMVKVEDLTMSGSGTLFFDIAGGFFKSSTIENELKTNRLYREKNIETVVTNKVQMTIKKK